MYFEIHLRKHPSPLLSFARSDRALCPVVSNSQSSSLPTGAFVFMPAVSLTGPDSTTLKARDAILRFLVNKSNAHDSMTASAGFVHLHVVLL